MSKTPRLSPTAVFTLRLSWPPAKMPAFIRLMLVEPAAATETLGKDWLRLDAALAHAPTVGFYSTIRTVRRLEDGYLIVVCNLIFLCICLCAQFSESW